MSAALKPGDRVQWIGVRTKTPRQGIFVWERSDGTAHIRTTKGGYTRVAIEDLEVIA